VRLSRLYPSASEDIRLRVCERPRAFNSLLLIPIESLRPLFSSV